MMTATTATAVIRRRWVALGYDFLNTLLWLPHGSNRLRRQLVEALELRPGMRVLELGCGTGLVTRYLVAADADVTAIDGSAAMLDRARDRAPTAQFVTLDLSGSLEVVGGKFDRVVLSFILHELDPATRERLLRDIAERLTGIGSVGILEWAVPAAAFRGRIWRAVVKTVEPSVAHDVLDGGIDRALLSAGLQSTAVTSTAGGRAQIILAVVTKHPAEVNI